MQNVLSRILSHLRRRVHADGVRCWIDNGAMLMQVVTDSAANCVRARNIIQDQYPKIIVAPCLAHCVDLALEDICKDKFIGGVEEKIRAAINFILSHKRLLAEYKTKTNLKLILPCKTRFKYVYIELSRALQVRDALMQCMFCQAFRDLSESGPLTQREAARTHRATILDDVLWRHAKAIVNIGLPGCELLTFVNGEVCESACLCLSCTIISWA